MARCVNLLKSITCSVLERLLTNALGAGVKGEMNAVEFYAIVENGHVALPENHRSWDGGNVRVILLDASSAAQVATSVEGEEFFSAAGIWAHRDDVRIESLRHAAWRVDHK